MSARVRRLLIVIAAVIIISAAGFALVAGRSLTPTMGLLVAVIQIAAAALQIILALGGGDSFKRFRVLNENHDPLEDLEVDLKTAGGVTYTPIKWRKSDGGLQKGNTWEPDDYRVDVTYASDVIVQYEIRYTRNGVPRTVTVACPPHVDPELHDILEVFIEVKAGNTPTVAAQTKYRQGTNVGGMAKQFQSPTTVSTNHCET